MAHRPSPGLTAVQFEIMGIVWNSPGGASVGEIWEAVSRGRDVARTTVLNLVRRLDRRGWLTRRKRGGVYRYVATIDRDTAAASVAEKFLDEFFGGSTRDLVMSLLGSKRISNAELDELRQLLQRARASSRKP
jgi:predicted transcriptional regulator